MPTQRPATARSVRRAPDDEPPDTYVYDPDDPLTYWLGRDLWGLAGQLDDRTPVERRPDVAVYSSEVLTADLEIMGPLSVELWASSSCPDTDFTAALVDVYAETSRSSCGRGRPGPASASL